MKDVILWELRRRRSAIFWWAVGSIALTAMIMLLFPSIQDKAADMNKMLNQLPPELRGFKTGGAAHVDVGDPLQFMNAQIFYSTLPIVWIILAITRGANILGREEQTKTLELLLARPISRGALLAAKAIAFFLEFMTVVLATFGAIAMLTPAVGMQIGPGTLLAATLLTGLFCFSFGYLAYVLQAASSVTKRVATATAVAIGFGGYILASLSSLTDWLKYPVKFVPYHYFEPLKILQGDATPGLYVYFALVFMMGSTVAYLGFRRRDIE